MARSDVSGPGPAYPFSWPPGLLADHRHCRHSIRPGRPDLDNRSSSATSACVRNCRGRWSSAGCRSDRLAGHRYQTPFIIAWGPTALADGWSGGGHSRGQGMKAAAGVSPRVVAAQPEISGPQAPQTYRPTSCSDRVRASRAACHSWQMTFEGLPPVTCCRGAIMGLMGRLGSEARPEALIVRDPSSRRHSLRTYMIVRATRSLQPADLMSLPRLYFRSPERTTDLECTERTFLSSSVASPLASTDSHPTSEAWRRKNAHIPHSV